MKSKEIDKNRKIYRRVNCVRSLLLYSLEVADLESFRYHLREYLKMGSTEKQAKLWGIPERTLRRLSAENSNPKLSLLIKIFESLRRSGQKWPEDPIKVLINKVES